MVRFLLSKIIHWTLFYLAKSTKYLSQKAIVWFKAIFKNLNELELPRILRMIFVLSVLDIVLLICFRTIFANQLSSFRFREQFGLSSLIFIASFWLAYFFSRYSRLNTLRNFLDQRTYRNLTDENIASLSDEEVRELNKDIIQKSNTSLVSQGTLLAVISLFLSLIIGNDSNPSTYEEFITKFIIVPFALLSLVLIIWAMDIFDTIYNKFKQDPRINLETRVFFYRHIGNWGLYGAASYRFYAFAALSIFIVSSIAFYYPFTAGLFASIYCYFGYPVLYGFTKSNHEYEIDLNKTRISLMSTIIFLMSIALSSIMPATIDRFFVPFILSNLGKISIIINQNSEFQMIINTINKIIQFIIS